MYLSNDLKTDLCRGAALETTPVTMFSNTAPFQAAVADRTRTRLLSAQDKLYAELTYRFQRESYQIQSRLETAIRTAASPRDFRVPLWVYNSVTWARSYQEARDSLGDEFEATHAQLKQEIDSHHYESQFDTLPVHTVIRSPEFRARLAAFFGDHFTVSLETTLTHTTNADYTAVERTVYLNYWTQSRAPNDPPGPPPSPIPLYQDDRSATMCYCCNPEDE